jgi:RNA polymerase sigma factor (sigma-70 family)
MPSNHPLVTTALAEIERWVWRTWLPYEDIPGGALDALAVVVLYGFVKRARRTGRERSWAIHVVSFEELQARTPYLQPEALVVPDHAEAVADRLTLHEALSSLSPREFAALHIRFIEERSLNEISRELGMVPDAVEETLLEAVTKLKHIMVPAREP